MVTLSRENRAVVASNPHLSLVGGLFGTLRMTTGMFKGFLYFIDYSIIGAVNLNCSL